MTTSAPEPMIGRYDPPTDSPLVPRIAVFLVALGLGAAALEVALFRPLQLGVVAVVLAPAVGGAVVLLLVRARATALAAAEPKSDARCDPFAWLLYVTAFRGGRWRGECEGRELTIERLTRRYGPPGLRLGLALDVPTRVSWSRRPAASRLLDERAGLTPEDGAPLGFPALEVASAERAWASRLFEARGVREAIGTLTEREETVLVVLRPGRLLVQYPFGEAQRIDEARARSLVGALAVVARAAESLERPTNPLERTLAEKAADDRSARGHVPGRATV